MHMLCHIVGFHAYAVLYKEFHLYYIRTSKLLVVKSYRLLVIRSISFFSRNWSLQVRKLSGC